MNIKNRRISWRKAILISFFIVFVLFIVAVYIMEYTYDQDFDSISPSGNKKVTVKIDYISCPDVFYKGDCIFEYSKSGFNETVIWEVEWLSEDLIKLYAPAYDDEEYLIDVSK